MCKYAKGVLLGIVRCSVKKGKKLKASEKPCKRFRWTI